MLANALIFHSSKMWTKENISNDCYIHWNNWWEWWIYLFRTEDDYMANETATAELDKLSQTPPRKQHGMYEIYCFKLLVWHTNQKMLWKFGLCAPFVTYNYSIKHGE